MQKGYVIKETLSGLTKQRREKGNKRRGCIIKI